MTKKAKIKKPFVAAPSAANEGLPSHIYVRTPFVPNISTSQLSHAPACARNSEHSQGVYWPEKINIRASASAANNVKSLSFGKAR